MTLSQLRREVNAIMRKLATEIAVCRTRRAADAYCDQWQELIAEKSLPPAPQRLFKRLPRKDYLRHRFPAVQNYLDDCRQSRHIPHPNEILRRLIPSAAASRLVAREFRPVTY